MAAQPTPSTLQNLRDGLRLFGADYKKRLLLVAGVSVLASGVEIVGAGLVYALLSFVVGDAEGIELPLIGEVPLPGGSAGDSTLLILILVTGLFFAVRAVVQVGSRYIQARVAHNAGARLAGRLMSGYLAMPYTFHLDRSSSRLIRNAHNSVQELITHIFSPAATIIAESILAVGLLFVLLATSLEAALLAIAIVGTAALLLLRLVQPKLKEMGRRAHQLNQASLSLLQQSLHGIRDVKVLGQERAFVRMFSTAHRRLARIHYLRTMLAQLPGTLMETALIGFILAYLAVAVAAGTASQEAVSVLGLFAYAGLRTQPSLRRIIDSLNSIRYAAAPVEELKTDLEAIAWASEALGEAGSDAIPLRQELRFENVHYRYPGAAADALREVNLTINRGEVIGICGPTGGGKSTLVDLMVGLLQPTTGHVLVDGLDLRYHAPGWQRSLGVVPQMIFLLDDTLRRNIALGVADKDVDQHAVQEAVDLAQLREFVDSLPHGLDTMVGERGIRLSGGQRQRIAIARALYRRPSVLIFDEGTSALDNDTEARLIAALEGMRGDRTIILVTHRLTTVKSADRVVFVDAGRVAGVGTFESLQATNPRFREMALAG